jgi:hypothetical protein
MFSKLSVSLISHGLRHWVDAVSLGRANMRLNSFSIKQNLGTQERLGPGEGRKDGVN